MARASWAFPLVQTIATDEHTRRLIQMERAFLYEAEWRKMMTVITTIVLRSDEEVCRSALVCLQQIFRLQDTTFSPSIRKLQPVTQKTLYGLPVSGYDTMHSPFHYPYHHPSIIKRYVGQACPTCSCITTTTLLRTFFSLSSVCNPRHCYSHSVLWFPLNYLSVLLFLFVFVTA